MEHLRNGIASTSGNLYSVNDMTPETVMSELNLFRPTCTSSEWNLSNTSGVISYTNGGVNSHPTSPTGADLRSSSSPKNEDQSDKSSSTLSNGEAFNEVFPSGSEFPMTPPTSESGPSTSGASSQRDEDSDGMPARKKRNPVPVEKKDAKYWDRRKKNNEAAKRSRDLRRKKVDDELKVAKDAMQENQKLKQEIDVLKAEINSLRRLLKDANMTLSLWIRARQASEPSAQLPPMLRGSNVSFVNFPVSTTI